MPSQAENHMSAGELLPPELVRPLENIDPGLASHERRHVVAFAGQGSDSTVFWKGTIMLYWTLVFFVVAIVAGLFGFGGMASASAGIAQILFFVFLVLLVVSLVAHVAQGRRPPPL
jgi:uncharacterized membrane protein YtjA (UPF0391 family)